MAYRLLHDLATIYLFRSCCSSCALYSSTTKLLVEFSPNSFTILCSCSCIPTAWEYPSNPLNSPFKILFRHQLLWRALLSSSSSSLSWMLLWVQHLRGTASLCLFTYHITGFIDLPPSLNWEFSQGRNCVVLIFITLMPSLGQTPNKFSKIGSELNTFSLYSKYLLTNSVTYFPETREQQ